ncbi:MAG: tRNA adenosine(34) deaminase TadA [Candidatus Brocadiia bacterium]|jgi:tRNA(adenine34) deaminase|nr:tRNA adenosine(34) deaminase TadA [Candidatus Brocadiia bacterium]
MGAEKMDEDWMREALRQAREALDKDEVPVGCVVVHEGAAIGRAHNMRETLADPTAHAEMIALTQAASALGRWHLGGVTVYCTLEPCCMCAGAMVNARIDRLVFGLAEPKSGACGSVLNLLQMPGLNHRAEVTGGVLAGEAGELMRGFFLPRRKPEE